MRAQGKTGPRRLSGCSSHPVSCSSTSPGSASMRIRPPGASSSAQRSRSRVGQAADADIAVREQYRGPPAAPGQRIEHRTVQGGRPGLAHPVHRSQRDVHAKRRNPPLGQRHRQPPGAAAHVEDGAAAVPEQFLVGRIGRPAPPGDRQRQRAAVGGPQDQRLRLLAQSPLRTTRSPRSSRRSPEGARPEDRFHRADLAEDGGQLAAPARRTGSAAPRGPRPGHPPPCPRRATAAARPLAARPRQAGPAGWRRWPRLTWGRRAAGRDRARAGRAPRSLRRRPGRTRRRQPRQSTASRPGVTCGVSIPISSAGPRTAAKAAARRSSSGPPHCGTMSNPGGSHGPGSPSSTRTRRAAGAIRTVRSVSASAASASAAACS